MINRVLRGHGDVHWRPTFSRDAIAPHERYQTWFSRISCRGKPRSPRLARGRCVVYLREILDRDSRFARPHRIDSSVGIASCARTILGYPEIETSTQLPRPRSVKANSNVCRNIPTLRASAGPRSRCMQTIPATGARKNSQLRRTAAACLAVSSREIPIAP